MVTIQATPETLIKVAERRLKEINERRFLIFVIEMVRQYRHQPYFLVSWLPVKWRPRLRSVRELAHDFRTCRGSRNPYAVSGAYRRHDVAELESLLRASRSAAPGSLVTVDEETVTLLCTREFPDRKPQSVSPPPPTRFVVSISGSNTVDRSWSPYDPTDRIRHVPVAEQWHWTVRDTSSPHAAEHHGTELSQAEAEAAAAACVERLTKESLSVVIP